MSKESKKAKVINLDGAKTPMQESVDNQSNLLEKNTIVKSPINNAKKILIIGSDDEGVIKNLKLMYSELFKETHSLYILDKDLLNRTAQSIVSKFAKWKDDQEIASYIKKPENLQSTLEIAAKIHDKVGVEWFVVDDIVDSTNMTYKQAQNTLELLFAFGFVAMDEKTKKTKYLLISDPKRKLKYIEGIEAELKSELKAITSIKKEFAKELKPPISKDKEVIEVVEEVNAAEVKPVVNFGAETQHEVGG